MLVALEGSSPTTDGENNYKYYVWQAHQQTRQSPKKYILGPATFSMTGSPVNIRKMATDATTFIRQSQGQIFLIGWSRGAAACIQAALDLKRSNFTRDIEAMFLFDPVDQDTSTSDYLNVIPSNVRNCYRAKATKKEHIWKLVFPTCGNRHESGVNYVTRSFNVSHGAISGTDGEGNDGGAKAWMWAYMRQHGVV